MQNVATSVRINGDAAAILSNLASKLCRPKAQIIEMALRDLEDRTFWPDVQRAFENLADDPSESIQTQAEIGIWERGSQTDFKDEQW